MNVYGDEAESQEVVSGAVGPAPRHRSGAPCSRSTICVFGSLLPTGW